MTTANGTERKITMMYDIELKRPACVLVQAAFGCDSVVVTRLFDVEDWLLAPTQGMRRISGTIEEWKKAAEITKRHRKKT